MDGYEKMTQLKIVVCVKHVGCVYHPTAVDLHSGDIDTEKMVFMLNPYDEVAVEAALRIKAQVGDAEITLVTAGAADAEKSLRYAGAMGGSLIDRMIRVHDDGDPPPDAWQTAMMLCRAIRSIDFDLILCGKKAIDTNGCQVGTFIAEALSLPQVSGLVDLELALPEKCAMVQRAMGKGDKEEVVCDLPALFTVDITMNDPRYPTMRNRFYGERMDIDVIVPAAAGAATSQDHAMTRTAQFSFPRPKTRKVFTPDSNLSVMERMNAMLMGGGAGKKENSNILSGSAEELAGYLYDFLVENKILEKDKR